MNLHSIRWRLPLSYIAIALVAALAAGAMMLAVLRGYYRQREREYIERNAASIASAAQQLLQASVPTLVLADQVTAWSFLLQARVQVYGANENLLADSGTPETQQVLMVSGAFAMGGAPFEAGITEGPLPFSTTVSSQEAIRSAGIFVTSVDAPGPSTDVILMNECPPGFGCVHQGKDEIVAGEFITGSEPFTQPFAISMPMMGSIYGFEMDTAAEISHEQRSGEKIVQILHDEAGHSIGRVIVSEGPAYGAEIVASVGRAWAIASLLALALAGAAGWLASRRIITPVLQLTEVTTRMSAGDLAARSGTHSKDEFGTLGRSFDQMAEQIETLVATLRRFVADAAHELNTPITALRTDLELACKSIDENSGETDRLAGTLRRAQQQLVRLQGLVHNLLDLSRLEGKTTAPLREAVDLAQVAQTLGEVYASRAEQNEIGFELELPEHPVFIVGDAMQLSSALKNLLDNAIKFTPPGGTVRLRLGTENAQAWLSVEDSGIGIPAEDLPLLFQRFHRGRNAAAYPGNGLGLAISAQIAHLHGGSIHAENKPGASGARFLFQIPVNPKGGLPKGGLPKGGLPKGGAGENRHPR